MLFVKIPCSIILVEIALLVARMVAMSILLMFIVKPAIQFVRHVLVRPLTVLPVIQLTSSIIHVFHNALQTTSLPINLAFFVITLYQLVLNLLRSIQQLEHKTTKV